MSKQIGFCVVLKPEFMEIAAIQYQRSVPKDEAREAIKQFLGRVIRGKEVARKTSDTLIRIWFSNDDLELKEDIRRNLEHHDMRQMNEAYLKLIRATYPFFDDVAIIIERQRRIEGDIDNKRVTEWVVDRWGDFPRVRYSVVKAIRTYWYFTAEQV